MASSPSMSVSVECVTLRNLHKGDSAGAAKHECSVLSCAWKAPRALTGSLASTTLSQCSSQDDRAGRGRRVIRGSLSSSRHDNFSSSRVAVQSTSRSFFHQRWKVLSSSTSPETLADISPETLWEYLKPAISYLPSEELKVVKSALKLAYIAHDGQKRRSGEPFIIHPVEVAKILGELELDWESIASGLLHDTVEDTNVVTFERIEKEFGATVRHIVEGETKVSKLGKLKCNDVESTIQDVKADDLRQMFLAMTEEVRVIIVKLADRLHNMRTLSHMPQHKQKSIAIETLQVFAPLAKLLGMYEIKSELENLSFMYIDRENFDSLKKKVKSLYDEHEKELVEAKKILLQKIENDKFLRLTTVKTEVHSVCREPYSVYKAMRKSTGSINDNQISQLRVIIQPKQVIGVGPLCSGQQICYHVLGLVHDIWTPIPRSMKDFIATPKPNGYECLHTTVIPFLYESMFSLEVQIRTVEMDVIAQRGIAAHYNGRGLISGIAGNLTPGWNSRGKSACLNNADIALRIGWLNAIREWQEEFVGNMTSREFVNTIMLDLLGSRVFVFTPKGEIKNLPKGATVIDYAYLIHTEIGNNMAKAKVNGNIVNPMHVLANAEVVEIITDNVVSSKIAYNRHRQWLPHAKTRSAKHKIMKFLKEQAAKSAAELTADAVNDFVADLDGEDETEDLPQPYYDKRSAWKKLLINFPELSSPVNINDSLLPVHNISKTPKINGKHNKGMQKISLEVNGNATADVHSITQLMSANIPTSKEVLPGLESWKTSQIASWHQIGGHSIQWFCVVCDDRKGMMAEVSSALTAAGLMICSCVAEIDRRRGMGVMLFQIEGSFDSLMNVCSSVDVILDVLGWSAGCSWSNPAEACNYLEC